MISINLNDTAWVRLTPHGEKVWADYWARVSPPDMRSMRQGANGDGWSVFPVWSLMEVFGPELYHGADIPFEHNEVRIRPNRVAYE